jgi:hypothetical protein
MTLEQFTKHFQKLTKFFTISNAAEKCSAYYEYFEHKDQKPWERVVEHIVQKKPRFPTLAECLELYEMFRGEDVAEECHVCTGSGWVYEKGNTDQVRRSPCLHGERLSKMAGATYHGEIEFKKNPTPTQIDAAWWDDMRKNPKLFIKGWSITGPIMRRQNPEIFNKVLKLAGECFGVEHEHAKAIYKVGHQRDSFEAAINNLR